MGSDKALLEIDGCTAIERQCELLEPLCPQGVFIAGSRSAELTSFRWPIIHDLSLDQGPLLGIISALQHAKRGTAFILAVDLLAVKQSDVASLLTVLKDDEDQQIDVSFAQFAKDSGEPDSQPLCAAWRTEQSLAVLREQFDDQQRSVMKAWLGLRRQGVSLPKSHLININSPRDMENFKDLKG
jgi:molybdopterin-guanine dinucleotide biosynthesis protein A